jgi:hypothetical protein
MRSEREGDRLSGEDGRPKPGAIPDHIVGPDRTLMHAFNLWITPEVRRREAAGLLTLPFGRDSLVLAMIPKRLVFLLAELNTPGGLCVPFNAGSSSPSCRTVCLRLRFRSLMKNARTRPPPIDRCP